MIIKQQQHNERHTNVSTMHSNMYHDHRGEFKSRIEYGMSIHIVWWAMLLIAVVLLSHL